MTQPLSANSFPAQSISQTGNEFPDYVLLMTSKQAFIRLATKLSKIYDEKEAIYMAAIVMQDAYGLNATKINDEIILNTKQKKEYAQITARLLTHEPVQYVLGKTIFFDLPLKLNNSVLIPRQETEELVAWCIETVNRQPSTINRILDIGTGSGCIPIAIKNKLPKVEVHALDVSVDALNVAKENAAINNVGLIFHEVDILNEKAWADLPKYDLIVSNPPYITEGEKSILAKNVIDFEPHIALFSGNNDAQRFVKKIVKFATKHLNLNGYLFFETNEFYAPDTKKIMEENGFKDVDLKKDLNRKDRMLKGRLG